jgi:hypothetical protein
MKKIIVLMIAALLVLSLNGYSQAKTQTAVQKSSTTQTVKKDIKTEVKVADKVVTGQKGPDGQAVYEGPQGGTYYINKNGNKTYLKAQDNVVAGKKGPEGQPVYQGPSGGQYYMNKNGNKTYLTPEKK